MDLNEEWIKINKQMSQDFFKDLTYATQICKSVAEVLVSKDSQHDLQQCITLHPVSLNKMQDLTNWKWVLQAEKSY